MFNSVTCHAYLGDISRANAALTANNSSNNNEAEIALPNISEKQEVADICLFGICAPVDLPGPVEDIVEDQLNDLAIDQLRPLFADEIPITGSNHKFYDSVVVLPGEPFAPQLLPLNALPLDSPIPPGDYEIPAHFYCTKIYSFDGQGNRFPLARLDGQMADVLSAIYSRASYDSSISTSDIQMLSWAIQTGMSYNELSDSQQALADRLIPDYRDRMESSFVERLTGIVNNASQISGNRLPGVNEILDKLGPIGDAAGSLLQAREQILRTNYSYQTLAQEFAPQQDAFLEGGTEETPWSQTRENVYMRFIAPYGAMDDGTVQVRILGDSFNSLGSSKQLTASQSSILVANQPIYDDTPHSLMVEDLTQDITQSVGVPETGGAQAITASLPPRDSLSGDDAMVREVLNYFCPSVTLNGQLNDELRALASQMLIEAWLATDRLDYVPRPSDFMTLLKNPGSVRSLVNWIGSIAGKTIWRWLSPSSQGPYAGTVPPAIGYRYCRLINVEIQTGQ